MKLDLSHTCIKDTIVVHSEDDVIAIFEAMAEKYPDSKWADPESTRFRRVYGAAVEYSKSGRRYALRCDTSPNGCGVRSYEEWGHPIHDVDEFVIDEAEYVDAPGVEGLL